MDQMYVSRLLRCRKNDADLGDWTVIFSAEYLHPFHALQPFRQHVSLSGSEAFIWHIQFDMLNWVSVEPARSREQDELDGSVRE